MLKVSGLQIVGGILAFLSICACDGSTSPLVVADTPDTSTAPVDVDVERERSLRPPDTLSQRADTGSASVDISASESDTTTFGADGNAPEDAADAAIADIGSGGDEDTAAPVPETNDDCVTHKQFFQEQVWAPFMGMTCFACHNSSGAAQSSSLVLVNEGWPGWLDANYESVKAVAKYQYEGESVLLLKPTGQIEHGGGALIATDSVAYANLVELLQRFDTPETCVPPAPEAGDFFEGVSLLDAQGTFRKATLLFAGRLPTDEERAFLGVNGWLGLDSALDALLTEDSFYDWLKHSYNDKLLTDRYDRNEDGINLLFNDDYPDKKWYDDPDYPASLAVKGLGDALTNTAVARAPLELMAHVVKNDLPFTEILTADYMMLNQYSARTYGAYDLVEWAPGVDADAFMPVALPGIPHAGILTDPMFLNRYPTTPTNRNRHRSRIIWDYFLATDILALAEQPIDPTSVEDHNPTLFNPSCTVCHDLIDPLAGAFQNWTAQGRYIPPEEGWFGDMLAPGFDGVTTPTTEHPSSLSWLAEQIASDSRFATATVNTAFELVTGHLAQRAPSALDESIQSEEEMQAKNASYDAQSNLLETIANDFKESGYNYKGVLKALVVSPYFRAIGLAEEPDEMRAIELEHVGTERLLTPRALHQKILTSTGIPWRDDWSSGHALLDTNKYRIFYGGIDSDQVNKRIVEPSGVMASLQQRMSNSVGCKSVPADFARASWERRLLPYVEMSYVPEDENGFEIPQGKAAIENNIRFLHQHLLNEDLPLGHIELGHTYDLWFTTWKQGKAAMESGDETATLSWICAANVDPLTNTAFATDQKVVSDPDYTVRAWGAVVAYLLSDYRFLYE